MQSKMWKEARRILAIFMAFAMVMTNFSSIPVSADEGGENGAVKEYVFEASALTVFAEGAKADGDSETAGTENYFTLLYSAKTKVDSSSKEFADGYKSSQRVNFGGKMSVATNAMKFTTSNAATVKIWWVCGGDGRPMAILDSNGEAKAVTGTDVTKNRFSKRNSCR